jgi:PAS domain S-box-containing protein
MEEQNAGRILLIDDKADNLAVVVKALREHGYQCIAARSGEAGLERAVLAQPDLIVLDVQMPGLDGFETCRRLKADAATRDIPVLFTAAADERADRVRGFEVGGVGFVNEPIEMPAFLARIKTHVEMSRLRRALVHTNEQLKLEIAERRQAEKALWESEERYRSLFTNNHAVMLLIDPADGAIVDANPAATAYYGWTREQLRQKKISQINTLSPQEVQAEMERARREKHNHFIFQHQLADGAIRDVEVFSGPITLQTRPLLYSIIHDITARQQASAILQLRLRLVDFATDHSLEELMQRALDEIGQITRSPIGFYHFVEADQNTLSLQAWSTRTLQEFCQAEGKGLHYSIDEAGVWVDCVRQRQPVIHNDYEVLPHRQGLPPGHAEVTRELVVPTFREGRIVSILGVGNKPTDYDQQDAELVTYVADVIWSIVERKRTEEQLQAYQRRLEAQNLELRKLTLAIEQSGSTIVITDTTGAIEYANPRFEETTGYTLHEALGKNPRILKSGKQAPELYRDLWETITSGGIWHGDLHNKRKDGTLYWESATIAPVLDEGGQITHYIAVKEDITERKAAAEALQHYAEQLAAQNAELDAFAHTVAHNLKNPVGIIVGFAEACVDDYETISRQDMVTALDHIHRSGLKLDRIIEALMLLSGTRKQEVMPEPLAMGTIVREAIQRLQLLIENQEAQITLVDQAAWPVALGYAPWVEEVWANYISNAIKYGGQPPQIEIGAGQSADHAPDQPTMIRFWVRDNGSGLTPEEQAKLFTPFTRLGQVQVQGYGLGLSIVQRIIEKLGGEVGVESNGLSGQGSTFYFDLPRAPAADR